MDGKCSNHSLALHTAMRISPDSPAAQGSEQIERRKIRAILIALSWLRELWFLERVRMSPPTAYLPSPMVILLTQELGLIIHPNLSALHFMAWLLDGSLI